MSSSSSSSNPFSAEEDNNNNNKNENNDQSKNKQMDDRLKFLEEAPSNIVPPPAYEDIEKPPPALPGYNHGYPQNNDQSYPPPRTPPTENYNRPNYFSAPSNFSRINRRNGTGIACSLCCCCGTNQNKSCGCCWLVVLLIFVILTTISVINNNVCNNLTIGDNPENFTFDPTANPIFYINVDNVRLRKGEVRIFSGLPTQQQVEVQVLTGSSGVTPKFITTSQNGIYELKIAQTSGFSLFNIPPRCMKAQVNINLPSASTTIKVRDLGVIVNSGLSYQQDITLITEAGPILLNGANVQNVNLFTKDGDILLSNAAVNGIFNISTDDGDIQGTVYPSDQVSIRTGNGNVDLFLKLQGANNKINIVANDAGIGLRFNNTFHGNYSIQSDNGQIAINDVNGRVNGNSVAGTIDSGGDSLDIVTSNGDVAVLF